MTRMTMLRLPDWAGEEIERIAERKGIPFATTIRELVCEKLREIAPATPYKDAASAFAVFLLFAKSVSYHVLNMLSSTVTSLFQCFIVLSSALLSGKVYKTIFTINLKVIIMGGVIGPAEMERIRKSREKKKK